MDLPFVDTRKILLDNIQLKKYNATGLTVDGEHLNHDGAEIVSISFAERLINWHALWRAARLQ